MAVTLETGEPYLIPRFSTKETFHQVSPLQQRLTVLGWLKVPRQPTQPDLQSCLLAVAQTTGYLLPASVAAIVVPVVVMMRKSDTGTSGVNDPYLTAGRGAALTDQEQMMGAYGTGTGGAAAPNGAAMAPSEMVVQFGGMVECMVKRGSLAYNGYGCYCGLGGGGKPLDATDRCCHQHDQCYSKLKQQGICKGDKSVYLTWYKSNMNNCDTPNAKIWCANHHQYSFFDSLLAGKQPRCAAGLCHCDRTAALCFARHSGSYNLNYASYQAKKLC